MSSSSGQVIWLGHTFQSPEQEKHVKDKVAARLAAGSSSPIYLCYHASSALITFNSEMVDKFMVHIYRNNDDRPAQDDVHLYLNGLPRLIDYHTLRDKVKNAVQLDATLSALSAELKRHQYTTTGRLVSQLTNVHGRVNIHLRGKRIIRMVYFEMPPGWLYGKKRAPQLGVRLQTVSNPMHADLIIHVVKRFDQVKTVEHSPQALELVFAMNDSTPVYSAHMAHVASAAVNEGGAALEAIIEQTLKHMEQGNVYNATQPLSIAELLATLQTLSATEQFDPTRLAH